MPRVLTVLAPTGGAGKTLVATNAAAQLAARGERVLLLDLDLGSAGATAVLAGTDPAAGGTFHEALYEDGQPLSPADVRRRLPEVVRRHRAGFDLLAPPDPALGEDITDADVRQLLHAADQCGYDLVVIDTQVALTDPVLAAADAADPVLVVAPLELSALRRLTTLLDVLDRVDIPLDRVCLLLNQAGGGQVHPTQAQDAFAGRFCATLPWQEGVVRLLDQGRLLVEAEPGSALARTLSRTVDALLPPEPAGRAG